MKWLLFSAAFAGAFLLEFNPALGAEPTASAAPVCSPEIVAPCEKLVGGSANLAGDKALGFGDLKPENGTVLNFLPLLDAVDTPKHPILGNELLEAGVPTRAQINRSIELGKKLRDRALALVLGVPYSSEKIKELTSPVRLKSMAPEKRIALERLLSLNFTVPERKHPACDIPFAEGVPNGMFDPALNTIVICNSMASQNEAVIALSLSHEIGHAISPTSTSLESFKIRGVTEGEIWEQAEACGSDFVYNENGDYNSEEGSFLKDVVRSGTRTVLGDVVDKLLVSLSRSPECPLEWIENSNTHKADIFASTRSCIERKTKAIYDSANPPAKRPQGDSSVSARMTFPAAAEEFADSFGAKLYDQVLPEMKWTGSQVRAALVAYRIGSCQQSRPGDVTFDPTLYPKASERILSHLSQPNAAKAVGCKPAAIQCPFKLDATAPVAPNTSTATKAAPTAPSGSTKGSSR